MNTSKAITILSQHAGIFRRAGHAAIEEAIRVGSISHKPRGAVLFQQGSPVKHVYFLLTGKVSSDLNGMHTTEIFPGMLGGASGVLLPNAKHSQTHTVSSEEGADVLDIPKDKFVGLIDTNKAFRDSIIIHFSNKNRRKNVILAQKFIPEAEQEAKIRVTKQEKTPNAGVPKTVTTYKTVPVINVAVYDAKPYDIKYLTQAFTEMERATNSPATPAEVEAAELVKRSATFRLKFIKSKLNSETAVLSAGCQAVCIFVNDTANAEVLQILKAMGIKMVLLRCAGFNNVDLECCVSHHIAVARVPAYSPYAVAEHAAALLLSLNRNIHTAFMRVRAHNFTLRGLEGKDLNGLTCGVFGTGKIGQVFVKIATGLGMKVLLWDKYPNHAFAKQMGATYVESFDELFPQCDVISLHLPLTPQTKHLINRECIEKKLKTGVLIVNTSRGPIIDTEALVAGLLSGKIGGAALDVYENEKDFFFEDMSDKPIQDNTLARLIGMPNVIITSHQAFFTDKALGSIGQVTAMNAREYFLEGRAYADKTALPPSATEASKAPALLTNIVLPEGYDPVTMPRIVADGVKASKL